MKDDPKQASEAERYIHQYVGSQATLFIPVSVILETEWVLRSVYNFQKQSVIELFVSLLETRELNFQDEASIESAIFLYRENNVDFADCLHVAAAFTHDRLPLMSFDKKATRVEGIEGIPR
ncbi:MAG: type II toxin-antitoxin system VapC family toxin [Gammaproteobacteria bacterium]|nr:type II toxin-antitoxin system VapC family toxin [Gammaproteobacteria bacterium]